MQDHPVTSQADPLHSAATVAGACPNFLYLGPAKSGSTWTYNLLDRHPEAFMAPGKGLYYFSSQFDRGESWYLGYFQDGADHKIRGEVAHNYLPTAHESCDRIHALNPDMRLMVCLREPCSRSFSAYLDGLKNGRYPQDTTLEQAIEQDSTIIDQSRYATHVKPYLETFGRDQLHMALFDDLQQDPQQFADAVCDFLNITRVELDEKSAAKMMPAGKPRFHLLVRMAKRASKLALSLGLRGLRGKVKTSRWIRNFLYTPYADGAAPKLTDQQRQQLQAVFYDEVRQLDEMFDMNLLERWGYPSPPLGEVGRPSPSST